MNHEALRQSMGLTTTKRTQKFGLLHILAPEARKKTANELGKIGIETYVPIQKQLRIWSDRKKQVDVSVIPMIIFAHIFDDDILKLNLIHS